MPQKRSRMTAQSKSDIEAAEKAILEPVPTGNGGNLYQVKLFGKNPASPESFVFVENAAGPISYSSMASAKKAVKTHNSSLNPSLAPRI